MSEPTVATFEIPTDIEGVTFSVEPNPEPLPTNLAEPQGEIGQ